jgi:hypothetical protein
MLQQGKRSPGGRFAEPVSAGDRRSDRASTQHLPDSWNTHNAIDGVIGTSARIRQIVVEDSLGQFVQQTGFPPRLTGYGDDPTVTLITFQKHRIQLFLGSPSTGLFQG